jgi:hypothetical protein
MINCRTKKTTWIRQAGATEEAARASAEGMVQEKGYVGSDGITYNINGHATYEFLLKDNAGLMKMIALVNVHDHNIVGVASDRLGAMRNYAVKMNGRGNGAVNPFQFDFLSVLVFGVPFIIGMDDNILIAELGFGSRRPNDEGTVLKVIERVLPFFVFGF